MQDFFKCIVLRTILSKRTILKVIILKTIIFYNPVIKGGLL